MLSQTSWKQTTAIAAVVMLTVHVLTRLGAGTDLYSATKPSSQSSTYRNSNSSYSSENDLASALPLKEGPHNEVTRAQRNLLFCRHGRWNNFLINFEGMVYLAVELQRNIVCPHYTQGRGTDTATLDLRAVIDFDATEKVHVTLVCCTRLS